MAAIRETFHFTKSPVSCWPSTSRPQSHSALNFRQYCLAAQTLSSSKGGLISVTTESERREFSAIKQFIQGGGSNDQGPNEMVCDGGADGVRCTDYGSG